MIYNVRRFGNQLRLQYQVDEMSYVIALMMEMELVAETSWFINYLTRLSARESFEFCRREGLILLNCV